MAFFNPVSFDFLQNPHLSLGFQVLSRFQTPFPSNALCYPSAAGLARVCFSDHSFTRNPVSNSARFLLFIFFPLRLLPLKPLSSPPPPPTGSARFTFLPPPPPPPPVIVWETLFFDFFFSSPHFHPSFWFQTLFPSVGVNP